MLNIIIKKWFLISCGMNFRYFNINSPPQTKLEGFDIVGVSKSLPKIIVVEGKKMKPEHT